MIRLDKMLSGCGLGSRKEIKALLRTGVVTVDGVPVKDASIHVHPDTQQVAVNGEILHYREFIYLMLHKPAGYVSATFDKHLPVVTELVPEQWAHFDPFPVGRLDIDTEGLLILTNDGAFAHSVLAPKNHLPKTYFAHLDGAVTRSDIAAFAQGIMLDDGTRCLPAVLTALAETDAQVVITEGKFHQVKRMFAAVGKKVLYLKRTAFGALTLPDDLPPGAVRELTEWELSQAQKDKP